MTHEQVAEALTREMGPKGTRRKERTYNCAICLDEGRVEVWHPDCVFVAATEGIAAVDGFTWKMSVCACYCDRGKNHATRIPKFDARRHCRIVPRAGASGRNCHPKALARLGEWIADRRREREKAAVKDPLFDSAGVSE